MDLMQSLKILGDEGRVRILRLLEREELSVADLQAILGMRQSRISMQLSQLRSAGFVEARRSGQKSLYHIVRQPAANSIVSEVLARSADALPEARKDDAALEFVLAARKDRLKCYFDQLAGKFGRTYVPGRSWKALAEAMIKLLPPMVIADFGAGEGTLAMMLAVHARHVIAIDNAPRMVEYGAEVARDHGIANLEYRLGDMEAPPVDAASIDMAVFHQSLHHALHPVQALRAAQRVLRPGGRIVVIDLLKHDFESAQELYADLWPGFSHVDLMEMMGEAGFVGADVVTADRADEPPHFETVVAIAHKPTDGEMEPRPA